MLLGSLPVYGEEKTIVVFGDSISAAYGMETEQGWVHLLAQRTSTTHPEYRIINASVSGETTGGGRLRLAGTLNHHQPAIVVLELGGNDGLRGYPIDKIRENLREMIHTIQSTGADVLLVGMVLPPNYGKRYTRAFETLFLEVSNAAEVPLLPVLLDGVTTSRSLIQRDGIHPKPEAQPLIMESVYAELAPLL